MIWQACHQVGEPRSDSEIPIALLVELLESSHFVHLEAIPI